MAETLLKLDEADRDIAVGLNDPTVSKFTVYLPDTTTPTRIDHFRLDDTWDRLWFVYDEAEMPDEADTVQTQPKPWIKFHAGVADGRLVFLDIQRSELMHKDRRLEVAIRKITDALRMSYDDKALRPLSRLSAEYARRIMKKHNDTVLVFLGGKPRKRKK